MCFPSASPISGPISGRTSSAILWRTSSLHDIVTRVKTELRYVIYTFHRFLQLESFNTKCCMFSCMATPVSRHQSVLPLFHPRISAGSFLSRISVGGSHGHFDVFQGRAAIRLEHNLRPDCGRAAVLPFEMARVTLMCIAPGKEN